MFQRVWRILLRKPILIANDALLISFKGYALRGFRLPAANRIS